MKLRSFTLITVILLFAALLRIYNIDAQSIWADEGFTYLVTQQSDILPILRSDVHPPLYFLGMKYWASASGTSEIALRLPSALASIVTVALIYLLGRELVSWRGGNPDSSPVPLIAALLMSLSDLEIDLSHEARMYTIHTALGVFSVLTYVRWLRWQRSSDGWLWGLSSALLVYVNYLGVWTPVAVGLHALLTLRGGQRRTALGILTAAALSVAPWIMLVGGDQIDNGAGADRADANTLDTLRVYRDNWFGQQWPLMLGLLALGTVTLESGKSARDRTMVRPITMLLLLWPIVPLVLTVLANNWLPVLAAHRISQITPAVCLLIAFGIGSIHASTRGFLVAVIAVSALTSVEFYRIKGPWESYTQTIVPYVQPEHLVLMEIGGGDTMLEYYFNRDLPDDTQLVSLKRWREGTPDEFYGGILPLLDEYQTVWLLHWSSEHAIFDWLTRSGYVETLNRVTPHIRDSRLNSYRFDRVPESIVGQFGPLNLRHVDIVVEPPQVDLFWTIDARVDENLVTSVYLLNAQGQLAAQLDSQPMRDERPTSTWRQDDVVYDPKILKTPDGLPLPSGEYSVGVVVYRFLPDGSIERLLAPDGADSLSLGHIIVSP